MPYLAQRTGQITLSDRRPTSLRVHEVSDDGGGPLCNAPMRPWEGQKVVFTEQGEGEVTCLRCERTRYRQEEQGLRPTLESRSGHGGLPSIAQQLRHMKVGERFGGEKAWVERIDGGSWIVNTPRYRATARTADRAAKLYAEDAFG